MISQQFLTIAIATVTMLLDHNEAIIATMHHHTMIAVAYVYTYVIIPIGNQ